jgi:hypothetical protein
MKNIKYGLGVCVLFAYSVSAVAADKHFGLIIREGFGSIKVGDVNTTLSSINSAYDSIREQHPERAVGEILPVPNGFKDWEAELRWNPWRGLSVGFAVSGPMRFYQKSFLTYTIIAGASAQSENDTWTSQIHISAPVKLNLYYSIPVFRNVTFAVNGGIGYYRAHITLKDQLQFRFETNDSSLSYDSIDVSGKQLGYHCGLALEYKFNGRFSAIIEGQYRFAKIRTFTGSISGYAEFYDPYGNLTGTDGGSIEGVFYHYIGDDYRIPYSRHEKLIVSNFPPPWYGADFPSDIRKAFLDLSGFTFKLGLKIGLF